MRTTRYRLTQIMEPGVSGNLRALPEGLEIRKLTQPGFRKDYGVWTTREWAKNEFLGEYTGWVQPTSLEAMGDYVFEVQRRPYWVSLDLLREILGVPIRVTDKFTINGSPTLFPYLASWVSRVNHGKSTANCVMRGPGARLFTKVRIPPNTQLLYDYGPRFLNLFDTIIPNYPGAVTVSSKAIEAQLQK